MLTIKKFAVAAVAALAVAAGIVGFVGLNLGGGEGGDVDVAEAHTIRSFSWFIIPNGTSFDRVNQFGVTVSETIGDFPSESKYNAITLSRDRELFRGCEVTVPLGLVPVPDGATEVTVPAGYDFALTEDDCYPSGSQPTGILKGDSGVDLLNVGSFTISVEDAPAVGNFWRVQYHPSVAHSHADEIYERSRLAGNVAIGETGLGFYCGRHYYWSEFEADEARALFLGGARRSQIGWVYVDSTGQQVAACSGYRPIYRPPGL